MHEKDTRKYFFADYGTVCNRPLKETKYNSRLFQRDTSFMYQRARRQKIWVTGQNPWHCNEIRQGSVQWCANRQRVWQLQIMGIHLEGTLCGMITLTNLYIDIIIDINLRVQVDRSSFYPCLKNTTTANCPFKTSN